MIIQYSYPAVMPGIVDKGYLETSFYGLMQICWDTQATHAAQNFLFEVQMLGFTIREFRSPQTPKGRELLRKYFPGVIVHDVRER